MSWTTRVKHPSEVLKKGDQVQAVLLNIDVDHERLSLGIKQLHPNPWEGIADSINVGDNVTGKVVRLTDFGAFIELQNGVEGLLHVSEISQQHVKKPEDVLSNADEITAKVIKLDEENRRIGLSIKAYEEEMSGEAGETAEQEDASSAETKTPATPEAEGETTPESSETPGVVETPADETAETPADETAETPADETAETPADETAETPADETAETPVKDTTTEASTEASPEAPAEEPAEEVPAEEPEPEATEAEKKEEA
jgi:small subunit ribosomal protein S1